MTPLGNSQPEEIANIVAFVASDECRYMTGLDRLGRRRPHDLMRSDD